MPSRSPVRRAQKRQLCASMLALLLCLQVALVSALPGDRDQPIHITADKAIRDENKGVTVYSGNVHMRQGSMELEADKLVIYHVSEAADKIVATGKPAKMRQQPEPDEGLVHAEADTVTYLKNEERVHLQTNARVERDGDLVTGDSIDYFIARQVIKAESDKTTEGEQVFVVIKPAVQEATESAVAADPNQPSLPGTPTPLPDPNGATE